MRHVNEYKHLDESDPLVIEMAVDEIAKKLTNLNYGVHRVLSAIVLYRPERRADDELALGIKALLEKGLY